MTKKDRQVIILLKYDNAVGLSKATGIGEDAISRIISGKRIATAEQKKILKKALEVGDEFFYNEE